MTVKRYYAIWNERRFAPRPDWHPGPDDVVLATDHDAALAHANEQLSQAQAELAEIRGQISYNERRSDNQLRTAIALQAEIAALRGREFELARAMEEIRSAIRDGGAKPSTMLDYIDGVAAKALKPDAGAQDGCEVGEEE